MLARRIFADGRTRAYAWGRARHARTSPPPRGAARDERPVRAAPARAARVPARGARRFAGLDARRAPPRAWRELQTARRLHDELTRDAATAAGAARRAARARGRHRGARAGPGGRAARRAGAAATRHRARAGGCDRRRRALAGGRRGREPTSSRRRSARSRRSSASRPSLRQPATRCDRPSCSCARPRPTCTRSSPRSRPSRGGSSRSRRSSSGSPTCDAATASQTYEELLERGDEARGELAALEEGHDPAQAAAEVELRRADDRGRPAPRRAPRGATRRCRAVRRRQSLASCAGSASARASSASSCRERDPGSTGADEVVFLVRPNAGPAVRAGRRDRLRRRAVADRARDRGGRRAARRWCSTRSTPASAARPRTPSARRSGGSPSGHRS